MSKPIVVLIVLFLPMCKKGGWPYTPPDIIDTTLGKVTFELNAVPQNNFHIACQKINNKIQLSGKKLRPVNNVLLPYQNLIICLDNNSLKKQRIVKLSTINPEWLFSFCFQIKSTSTNPHSSAV